MQDRTRPRTRKEKKTGFRKYRGIKLSEEEQGIIFYTCLRFPKLNEKTKKKIERLCIECAGEYRHALFELVTTRKTVASLAYKHHTSGSTLYELRKKFYESWYK